MTWSERLAAGLLVIVVFGVLFVVLKYSSPEFRDCLAKFYPQSYCNSQELIRNLSK